MFELKSLNGCSKSKFDFYLMQDSQILYLKQQVVCDFSQRHGNRNQYKLNRKTVDRIIFNQIKHQQI